MPDGSYQVENPPAPQREALQTAIHSLHACGLESRTETKPGGLAVHWRGLSPEERMTIENKVRMLFAPLVQGYGLHLLPFDGGLEVRASARNKGDAVNSILAEMGNDVAAAY